MMRFPKTILLAGIVASAVASSFSGQFDPYFLHVGISIGIHIILAVSLNLVNGYTGQFSLGHAGFMAVGAYSAAWITTVAVPAVSGGAVAGVLSSLMFLGALLAGGLMAGLVGLIVGIPTLRLRGDYLAIATLGFGEIIRIVFHNMDAVGGARGLAGIPVYTNLFWTYTWVALTIYFVVALVHSTYGRGFLAVRDDEIAAEAIGINTTRYKVTAFFIGAFFAGIAGGLYSHFMQFISPEGFGFMKSIEIVVMVILGGMGNTPGVILAAGLLTIVLEVLRGPFAEYRMIIYSLILVILMLARPQGLFQWRKRSKPILRAST